MISLLFFREVHLQSTMWHFANTSLHHCCQIIRLSAARSLWQCPLPCRQLHNCSFGLRKPSFSHLYGHIFGQLSCSNKLSTLTGRFPGLLNLCSLSARHHQCTKYLRRSEFVKQLRYASNTKSFQSVVSSPAQQASKRIVPETSEVYRLLLLAKPEKWKLLGENMLSLSLIHI